MGVTKQILICPPVGVISTNNFMYPVMSIIWILFHEINVLFIFTYAMLSFELGTIG